MTTKWFVKWTRPDGMKWTTSVPLNHYQAADKVRRLMRKRRNGPAEATEIHVVPAEVKP